MLLLPTAAALLTWATITTTATACLSSASRHEIFLPLLNSTPAVANQTPLNPAGYGVSDLGQGAYMITDGVYQSLVLVSTAGVVVVDAPPTIGHKLGWAIGNLTSAPVRWLVYSHSHADHAGGAYLFADDQTTGGGKLTIIAHENTAEQLAAADDPHRPVPNITFTKHYRLVAGNQTLELAFPGVGHDLGNIIIYAPRQRVLMMVDQVYAWWVPFANLASSVYVPGWIRGHDQILAYDFDVYLGGHLGGPANRTAVEVQREYVHDLMDNCAAAIVESANDEDPGVGLAAIARDVLAKNPNNFWAVTAVSRDIIAERCYNVTNEKWLGGRLAAQDVFGYGHARAMVNTLRIDYDVLGPNGVAALSTSSCPS